MGLFKKKKATTEFFSLCHGEAKDITNACDEVFAQKMMGDGVMFIPNDGTIYAPCDGEITMTFPTKHAIGITLNNGIEMLLHFGVDTVNLDGKGFRICVNQGDHVHVGDVLWNADLTYIKANAPSEAIMVIITTCPEGMQINKELGVKQKGDIFLRMHL